MSQRHTPEGILETVAAAVADVIDEDLAALPSITRKTVFATDLELESIEIVALSERLQELYGEDLDLAGWLSSIDLAEVRQLTVAQLVDYIFERLASGS